MSGLQLDKAKFNRLVSGINEMVKTISNLEKPLKKSGQILKDEQQLNFESQGAIYQGLGFTRSVGQRATTSRRSWAPLALSTQKDRVAQGYRAKRPILIRTGRLRKGFVISKVSKNELKIVNRVPYAKYHQTGTARMPQRAIIGISKKSDAAIKLVFANHIRGVIEGYFKR